MLIGYIALLLVMAVALIFGSDWALLVCLVALAVFGAMLTHDGRSKRDWKGGVPR